MLPSLQNIHAVKIRQHVCNLSVMDVGVFSSVLLQVVLLLPRGGENVSERHWTTE